MGSNGILILGHGTPSEEGNRAFMDIVKLVEAMAGGTAVAAGFMEFASPTIADGITALHRREIDRIAAVPVFLSGAGHTAKDIPKGIADAIRHFPEMQVRLTAHVGSHSKVAELSALRYKEAIADRKGVTPENTLLVIAAHGSPEPEAFEELERFADSRRKLTPVGRISPCFSQMGNPLLKDVLPAIVASPFQRIVVQPHFLLKGRLSDAIVETVGDKAEMHPEIEFIVTEPLGCHQLLAQAALELGGP